MNPPIRFQGFLGATFMPGQTSLMQAGIRLDPIPSFPLDIGLTVNTDFTHRTFATLPIGRRFNISELMSAHLSVHAGIGYLDDLTVQYGRLFENITIRGVAAYLGGAASFQAQPHPDFGILFSLSYSHEFCEGSFSPTILPVSRTPAFCPDQNLIGATVGLSYGRITPDSPPQESESSRNRIENRENSRLMSVNVLSETSQTLDGVTYTAGTGNLFRENDSQELSFGNLELPAHVGATVTISVDGETASQTIPAEHPSETRIPFDAATARSTTIPSRLVDRLLDGTHTMTVRVERAGQPELRFTQEIHVTTSTPPPAGVTAGIDERLRRDFQITNINSHGTRFSFSTAQTIIRNRRSLTPQTRFSIPASQQLAVILDPTVDGNGAFSVNSGRNPVDHLASDGRFFTLYYQINNEADARSILERVQSQTGRRIHTLVVAGHGDRHSLTFGDPSAVPSNPETVRWDSDDIQAGELDYLNNVMDLTEGQILLYACSNGATWSASDTTSQVAIVHGLGDRISGVNLYSSSAPANIHSFVIRDNLLLAVTWEGGTTPTNVIRHPPTPQLLQNSGGSS